jgi:hypothetical protein
MRGLSKSLILGSCVAAVMMSAVATPSFAFTRIIDPSILTPAQQARLLAAPLGDFGPFGERADPLCQWSRLQVPTVLGLRWIAVESCNNKD